MSDCKCCLIIRALYLLHSGVRRARSNKLLQIGQDSDRATHHYFDPAVRQIPGVPAEAQGPGMPGDEPAEPHTLYLPRDQVSQIGHSATRDRARRHHST
jgi:hypothetical protein